MKLLLTSGGIRNTSIHNALVDLLGKPIAESRALIIPTAAYVFRRSWHRMAADQRKSRIPLVRIGLEVVGSAGADRAAQHRKRESWVPMVQETDALLVGGGDVLYLCYWMRQSGLADLLPSLRREMVYVGVSAGSMVVASPDIGAERRPRRKTSDPTPRTADSQARNGTG